MSFVPISVAGRQRKQNTEHCIGSNTQTSDTTYSINSLPNEKAEISPSVSKRMQWFDHPALTFGITHDNVR